METSSKSAILFAIAIFHFLELNYFFITYLVLPYFVMGTISLTYVEDEHDDFRIKFLSFTNRPWFVGFCSKNKAAN